MIEDIIRSLFWGIVSAVMRIMDATYDISIKVASVDILDFPKVWDIWAVLMTLLVTFILVKVIKIGLKAFTDADYLQKLDIFKVVMRLVPIVLIIVAMPITLRSLSKAGIAAVKSVPAVVGHTEATPSTILLSSVHGAVYVTAEGQEIEKNFKLEDIEINLKENKKYVYFPELGDIFILLIVAGVGAVGFLLNALQIAKRVYSLGLKIFVSPLPIADYIDPESELFSMWLKMVVSDIVSNFIQMLLLIFVMIVSTSKFIRNQGMWVVIVMFLGGVLVVLSGVPEIARLIGGDTSSGSALQQLASLRQATSGIGRGAGKALSAVSSAAGSVGSLAGAGAGYAAGRALGGFSMTEIANSNSNSSQGFASTTNERGPQGFLSGGQSPGGGSNVLSNQFANHSNSAFNQNASSASSINNNSSRASSFSSDSSSQSNYSNDATNASSFNNDTSNMSSFNSNSSSMSNLNDNGSTLNAFTDVNTAGSQGYSSSNQTKGASQGFEGGARAKGGSVNGSSGQNTSGQHAGKTSSEPNIKSYAKPDSVAGKFASWSYQNTGIKAAAGRMASNGGRHIYQASMNRLQNNSVVKVGTLARKAMQVPDYINEQNQE